MSRIPITLVSAATLPYANLALLINQSYTDYFLSVWLDEHLFTRMCRDEDIDLENSVVAMAGEAAVGLALFSRREDRGWVSAVGVLPHWRRQGIARQIMQQVQENALALKLAEVRLEVLDKNEAALSLYAQLDFTWERDLLVLSHEPGIFSLSPPPPGISVATAERLLQSYHRMHETRAPWQRAYPSLCHRSPRLQGLGLWEGEALVGYLLYEAQVTSYAIADLAALPGYPQRLPVARTLLATLHRTRSDMGAYIINVAAEDPLLAAFTGLRYRIWYRQHELAWKPAP